jgi:hypothetical protein
MGKRRAAMLAAVFTNSVAETQTCGDIAADFGHI